jgi:peroxiredoxin
MALDPEMRALYQEWGIDLVEANGNDSYELPVPATYVIDYDGIIRAAYVDKDYTRRMEPADIIAALKAL